ncbi:MAG: hypothetical protein IT315_08340 [Anaerolineales bacterium]|nr:hypothetical protein [Anaerolineales bacterium]
MFKINRFTLVSLLLVGAYLLSACSGALPNSIPQGDGTEVEVESSNADDGNSNDDNGNDVNDNDDNSNDDNGNDVNDNGNDDNSNDDNSNSGNDNGDDDGDDDSEIVGVVEALTADSVTINGVTYLFADFTEFEDIITVGDQVEIHVIVNADGTFTIREIEKSGDLGDDNSNDDNGNDDDNSNDDNSNDDGGDDNSNDDSGNSNDDDDDNGNDNDD